MIYKLALDRRLPTTTSASARPCSKGTYIRTLGEDIGEALGCGAHLTALRRIATGGFDVSQCVTLDALEAMDEDERLARLLPTEALVADHTPVTLDAEDAGRFLSGLRRRGDWPDAPAVAVFGREPACLSRHGPRQGRRTDPGALAEPHRNPADTI